MTFLKDAAGTPGLTFSTLEARVDAVVEVTDGLGPLAFREADGSAAAVHAPTPVIHTVIDCDVAEQSVTWAADPAIVYWRGLFWLLCDGNRAGGTTESAAGQNVILRTSATAAAGSWSTVYSPFHEAAHCNNPIVSTAVSNQANLIVVDDVLWAFWNRAPNAQISRLNHPDEKWTNYRLEWVTATDAPFLSSTAEGAAPAGRNHLRSIDGVTDYFTWFPGDPLILSDGVVAMPVTFMSSASVDPATSVSDTSFYRATKFNAVMFSTDMATWTISDRVPDGSTTIPAGAWEPTLSEAEDGALYLFSRNLRSAVADADSQIVAVSYNRKSFTATTSTGLDVPNARSAIHKASAGRWLQSHCDHLNGTHPLGRFNGALFVSRRGVDDFVPAFPFSDVEWALNYPVFCIVDGYAYVVYAQDTARRSMVLAKVAVPTDDDIAYVYPRRQSIYTSLAGPTLNTTGQDSWSFNGVQRATPSALLDSTGDLVLGGWFKVSAVLPYVLIDARHSAGTTIAPVLREDGLSIGPIIFSHGQTITRNTPFFFAANCEEATGKVSFYFSNGGGTLVQVDNFLKALTVGSNPSNLDTLIVDGVTFTFKTVAGAAPDVLIGVGASATCTNLIAAINATAALQAGISAAGNKLLVARDNGATFTITDAPTVTVDVGGVNFRSGQAAKFGYKRPTGSTLAGLRGNIYRARAHKGGYVIANMRFLVNELAAALGLSTVAGTSTDPGAPTALLTETSTTATFPDLADLPASAAAATAGGVETLTLTGEGSASVEAPWESTSFSVPFKLGALPAGTDKYVVASIGTRAAPIRVYIPGSDPTNLYVNGAIAMPVRDPTRWNTVEIIVTPGRVHVGTIVTTITAPGGLRMYLGQAWPETLLLTTQTTLFNVTDLRVAEYKPRRAALDLVP